MTVALRAYPEYKPSGVEWLGDVPAHWEVTRLKARLRLNDSGVWGDDFSNDGTIVLRSTEQTIQGGWRIYSPAKIRLPVQAVKSALLKTGDLVITKSSGSELHIGKTSLVTAQVQELQACFSNFMQRLRLDGTTEPALVWRNLNSRVGREQLVYQSTSTTGIGNLNGKVIGNCLFAFPPLAEQSTIADYLDHADSRIQRYISAKERRTALLTEQKQAIINQAVTRGLDPNVRLKPSGVEWLGDVPAHWDVLPIKRAFISMDYGISESSSNSGSIRLLTMGNINEGRVAVPQLGDVASVAESLLLRSGDLLFNRTNSQELVGKVGLFTGHETPVTFASYLVRLRTSPQHRPEYLNTVLNDVAILAIVRREAIPSLHQSNLNPTRYGRIRIPLPPLSEQVAILEYLGKATEDIDASIDRTHRQIELMHEYRTRLIADVVTGKLNVSGAVADEVEIPTP